MRRIAIIEDNNALATMYEFKLKLEGYEVKCAANGAEGLALLQDFQPDVVLLDLRMPVMTGDEMLEKLRATDWGASMRVIVLTNISRAEAPQRLRFLGVDRYVVKAHTTPSQVVETVREVLAKTAQP